MAEQKTALGKGFEKFHKVLALSCLIFFFSYGKSQNAKVFSFAKPPYNRQFPISNRLKHIQAERNNPTNIIQGKVVSAEDNMGLIRATIGVRDLDYEILADTHTDIEGNFKLEIPPAKFQKFPLLIEARYFGFTSDTLEIKDFSPIIISLQEIPSSEITSGHFYILKPPWHKRIWSGIKSLFKKKK